MKTSQIHNRNKFARILKSGFGGQSTGGFLLHAVENNRAVPLGMILAKRRSKFVPKDRFDLVIRNIGSAGYSKAVHQDLTTGDIVKRLPPKISILVSAIKSESKRKSATA